MFEKEAEEIANKRCHEIMCFGHCSFSSPKHHRCGEWHREYNCAKEGIEYGYRKANEWHYVKDGDLPTKITLVLIKACGCFILGWYDGKDWFNDSDNGCKIPLDNVYAWHELPEPPKESEIESEIFPEITLPEGSAEHIDEVIADAEKRLKWSE